MQRLTENDGKGNWQLKGLPWEELAPGKGLTAEASQLLYGALCKLKDLEDAGLNPKSAEAIDWLYLEKCKEVNELRKKTKWIPVEERLPETDIDILLSFINFSLPAVGVYRTSDDGGGVFYLWDCDGEDTCISQNLYVNAWMPLPESYRPWEKTWEKTWEK